MKPSRMRIRKAGIVRRDRMSFCATPTPFGLPVSDDGPIEEREEGAVILHHRINVEHGEKGVLVKDVRVGYHHDRKLLCESGGCDYCLLCKRSPFFVKCRRCDRRNGGRWSEDGITFR